MTSYEWTLVAHEHGPGITCPHGCELCRTCGELVKMMSQRMSGYCSPRCEQVAVDAMGEPPDIVNW